MGLRLCIYLNIPPISNWLKKGGTAIMTLEQIDSNNFRVNSLISKWLTPDADRKDVYHLISKRTGKCLLTYLHGKGESGCEYLQRLQRDGVSEIVTDRPYFTMDGSVYLNADGSFREATKDGAEKAREIYYSYFL